jgi:long-chain acyl-CoA synthetase
MFSLKSEGTSDVHIAEWIEQLFDEEPDGPAVQFEGEWWTWSDMKRIRDGIDSILASCGIGAGAGIGLVLRERPHSYGAYLALLNTKRCSVLITPIAPDALMVSEVEKLRVPALIADRDDWGRPGFVEAARTAGSVGIELTMDKEDPIRIVPGLAQPTPEDRYEADEGVAVTILTSGTTGPPKRIPLAFEDLDGEPATHGRPPWKRGVSIGAVPLVSIGGATGVANTAWRGRPTALMDRFDPLKWAELVREHKPQRLGAPPATLRMLLDRKIPREYLESGKVFSAASAPVDLATSDEFEREYGIPVIRAYGATEFLGAVTGFVPDDYPLAKVKRGSVGRALPGCKVRIIDPATGIEVPPGEIGILEADPPRRPVGGAPGWIRTNDLARMDEDGFVWIEGRADGVLIRGGFKVAVEEVAQVLRGHPAVADAAVVGLDHPTLNQVPAALVELRPGVEAPQESELMQWVKDRKPPYYVPVRIKFAPSLPRNAMLKVVGAQVKELVELS